MGSRRRALEYADTAIIANGCGDAASYGIEIKLPCGTSKHLVVESFNNHALSATFRRFPPWDFAFLWAMTISK